MAIRSVEATLHRHVDGTTQRRDDVVEPQAGRDDVGGSRTFYGVVDPVTHIDKRAGSEGIR